MKKEIKGFIIGSLTTLILTASVGFATGNFKTIEVEENGVTIYANDNYVDAPNFLYNDRTYVPLRAVLELMDCWVEYYDETNIVAAYNNYQDITSWSGVQLNGNTSKTYKTLLDENPNSTNSSDAFYVSNDFLIDAGFALEDRHDFIMLWDRDKYVGIDTNAIPHTN